MTSIVKSLSAESITTSCEPKIGASMNHVHRIRMVLLHKELKLLLILFNVLLSPLFSPMSLPSSINLSSKNNSLFLESPCIQVLIFNNSSIDTNMSPFPMAFLNVLYCVHIIFRNLDPKIKPNFPQSFNITLITIIEPILIFYLQKNNTSIGILLTVLMFFYYFNKRGKIQTDFFQKCFMIWPQLHWLDR